VIGESRHYKNQLLRFAKKLDAWHRQPTWTEGRFDEYEYQVFCSFFIIRRLLECNKLSERIAQREVPVDVYRPTGERITLMSRHDVWELYDLARPSGKRKTLPFLCNQVIHSYVFQIWSERGGRKTSLFFSSDRERRRAAYRLTRGTLRGILRAVGTNYPSRLDGRFDKARQDFVFRMRD
jgi:hypothetical protein